MKYLLILSILTIILSCTDKVQISPTSELRDTVKNIEEEVRAVKESENLGNELRYIFLHATQSSGNPTTAWFHNFFTQERGWVHDGYNLLLRKQGDLKYLQGWDWDNIVSLSEIANGVRGVNRYSLHIGIVGCYTDGKIEDTRTEDQKDALNILLPMLNALYPRAIFLGHRDWWGYTVAKECPCFDLNEEYPYLNEDPELYEMRMSQFYISTEENEKK